jgi:5-methylcytosine-specific restriction enzyme subunit McrC
MGRSSRVRVPATEYVTSADVLPALIAAGMTSTEATAVLARNSARLRRSLRLGEGDGPFLIDGETVKVVDIAGVVRLAPGVELDVAPKFLGFEHPGWREDLLAISNYTLRGKFTSQQVRARLGRTGDLASAIGRAFVDEFWKHYRKPLRLYREHRWRDFSLDGDLDTDDIHVRTADGLPQRAVVLDRRNPYNAMMARAADVLIADVRDSTVRAQLHRVRGVLGGQDAPPRHLRPVPARHEPWAPLVELSERIASGADLTLHADRYEAPGYVLRTWEAWERLTFLAIRNRLGFSAASAQVEHAWGSRDSGEIRVKPDVTIGHESGVRLVDAKYKTRVHRTHQRISQGDLMEAAAFMAACQVDRIVLLYPRSASSGGAEACGSASVFDSATLVPGRRVVGVEVEVRGFSARNEHRRFGERLTAAIDAAFELSDPHAGQTLT